MAALAAARRAQCVLLRADEARALLPAAAWPLTSRGFASSSTLSSSTPYYPILHPPRRGESTAVGAPPNTVVGFAGLGAIGSRLAARLAARHTLRVLDTSSAAADAFMVSLPPTARVQRVHSPAALAAECGAVVTSLPTADAVKAFYEGENGLLAAPGSATRVAVDISTTDPSFTRGLADAAAAAGVTLVAAPVSGGVKGAEDGSLTFLVSAACKDATKAATPLLHVMGRRVVVVSVNDPGAAQAAKLANQIALAAQMAGVAEALAYGAAQGLCPVRVSAVLHASTGRSWSSEVNNPSGVVPGSPATRGYEGGFASRLMLKDLTAAAASAGGAVPLPMTETAASLFARACAAGGADKDFSIIFESVYGCKPDPEAAAMVPVPGQASVA